MTNRGDKPERQYDLEERLLDFTIEIIELVEALPQTRVGNHIAGQLVRCGTSPAPNYGEAQSAESRRDFIHKMKVVLKELREIRVWLLLIHRRALVKQVEKVVQAQTGCNALISIFVASIGTAEGKRRGRRGDETMSSDA